MMWLYLLALAIIGTIVVVLIGRWEGAAPPAEEGPAAAEDPVDGLIEDMRERGLSAELLDEAEFDSAVRGYRMDQVDKLLAAVSAQLREQDVHKT